jgi:hypothetical protein
LTGELTATLQQGVPFLDAGHPAISFDPQTLPFVNQDARTTGGINAINYYPGIK